MKQMLNFLSTSRILQITELILLAGPLARERINCNRAALKALVSGALVVTLQHNLLLIARTKQEAVVRKSKEQKPKKGVRERDCSRNHLASTIRTFDIGCVHKA